MKNYLLLFSLVLFVSFLQGQNSSEKKDTASFYFLKNSYSLSPKEEANLKDFLTKNSNFCDSLGFEIHGYGCTDGNATLNYNISVNRINTIVAYLKEKCPNAKLDTAIMSTNGFRKPTKEENRRIDILVHLKAETIENESDSIPNDTLQTKVYVDSLFSASENCEVLLSKEIVEGLDTGSINTLNVKDISANEEPLIGFTQAENGNPLYSAGMFELEFKGDTICSRNPIKVYFPVKSSDCYLDTLMTSYSGSEKGWKEDQNVVQIKIIEKEGKKLYEMTVECPGRIGGSQPSDTYVPLKFKVKKLPEGFTLKTVRVFNDCNTLNLTGELYGSKMNKVRIKVPFEYSNLNLQYVYTDKEGNEIKSEPVKLSDSKKGGLWRFCRVYNDEKGDFKKKYFKISRGIRSVKFAQ